MSCSSRVALVAALLAALVCAGVASADIITISGTGKGVEVPKDDGVYALRGTWSDSATGAHGTYAGTLDNVGDYTTCIPQIFGCTPFTPPELQHCNVVRGEITFSLPGKSFSLPILPIFSQIGIFSYICLDPNDPSLHNLHFEFYRVGPPAFTVGYGDIVFGRGTLTGTSAPAGASGVFLDRFGFSVNLFEA
jgi:hypothetical protein